MMPDVAFETPAPTRRDLVIVEAKDKYRMKTQGKAGAMTVGHEYRQAACATVTWVVNYCPFPDPLLHDPRANFGDPWHALHFASEFRPGAVPDGFALSIGQSLRPPSAQILDPAQSVGRAGWRS